MNNLTCASLADLNRLASFNFILFQFVDLVAASITFIFTYFAMDKPCELLQLESVCEPYMKTLLTCTSGMIYCQTGLILERTCATFLKDYQGKKSLIIGSIITIIVVVCSSSTGPITYWDDPLTGALLGCFQFPKQSSNRSIIYFFVVTVVTVINLTTSIVLRKYNKKLEYQVRFKLCARFNKREVIQSTGTICFLTFSQVVLMFVYSLGISILKLIRSDISLEQYHKWVVWLYTIPYIAMLFPILLIYQINKTKSYRNQVLVGIKLTMKQTQDEHITQMKTMWK